MWKWLLGSACVVGTAYMAYRFYNNRQTVAEPKEIKNNLVVIQTSKPKKKCLVHRESDFYENCRMEGPDGKLLALVGRERCQWYLRMKLAIVVSQDPFVIRLLFEPKNKDSSFRLEPIKNECVVCGETEKLRKHSVVPHPLRKHFSKRYKDIVLLCGSCHLKIDGANEQLLAQLCKELSLRPPFAYWSSDEKKEYQEKMGWNKESRGLVLHFSGKATLPPERVALLTSMVRQRLALDEKIPITTEHVAAAEIKVAEKNDYFLKIAKHYKEQEVEILARWHAFFKAVMEPKFLSEDWPCEDFKQRERVIRKYIPPPALSL